MSEVDEPKRKPMGTTVLTPGERNRIGEAILVRQLSPGVVARHAGIGLNAAIECAVETFHRKLDAERTASFRRGRLSLMPNLPPMPPAGARKKAA